MIWQSRVIQVHLRGSSWVAQEVEPFKWERRLLRDALKVMNHTPVAFRSGVYAWRKLGGGTTEWRDHDVNVENADADEGSHGLNIRAYGNTAA